jgi:DNA polymerase phi
MTTLPLFWHLSSIQKKERISASIKLVTSLERFQVEFVPQDSPETSGEEDGKDATKCDGLDALNAQDVAYSIRRLVRGLASPRECSRLGFGVALTEVGYEALPLPVYLMYIQLLSRIDTVTCPQIIALINDSSKTHGSMSGQEERDVLFARLFGFTAVIQSGLLVRKGSSHSSATDASSLPSFQDVLIQLIALGEKKSWLRESAWWTIALMVDSLERSDVSWRKGAVDAIIQNTLVETQTWSPEKVALVLKLRHLFPERDWATLVSPSFKDPDLLSGGNLSRLARILKVASRISPLFSAVDVPSRRSPLRRTMTCQNRPPQSGNLKSISCGTSF